MKKYTFLSSFCFLLFSVVGQNTVDLVRYSNIQLQGGSRFESMGGSFGALGADLSSGLINPAGFGRYSSNQFNVGLNYNHLSNQNTFQGNTIQTSRNPVRPSNLGIVLVTDVSSKNKGFLYSQFGFTYNRIENLSNTLKYAGKLYNSLLDGFAAAGNQLTSDQLPPFSTQLAWNTYAIDENGSGGYVPRLTADDTMYHQRSIESKGGISEYTFSYSTNYINKLYIGINWGIRTIRYTEEYQHREKLDHATLSLDSFYYQYNLNTKGKGNNFKVGLIYLPFDALRLGLSVHTPTYYSLTDQWSADMTSFHADTTYGIPAGTTPKGNYKYRLRTPPKVVGSIAYVFGTHGCINVDLEYLNYAWANLKSTKDPSYTPDPSDYRDQNKEANELLRSVLNLRIGGELVFQSQFFLRGGYAYYPQPYKTAVSTGTSAATTYSAGAGMKFNKSSIDFCLKYQTKNYNYYAFTESKTTIQTKGIGFSVCYTVSF